MGGMLIRDLPSETHDELKRRARGAGMSLQAYVAEVLNRHTAVPALEDWLSGLDELPRHPELSGAAAVRAARSEQDEMA